MSKFKFFVAGMLAALLVSAPVVAQISVPYTFSPNTTILSSQVNANFAKFADALNRTGGNLTGVITADANITIDGADISDFLTATQVLTQAVGSETTPSFSVVGDLNTGMYFNGADSIAFSTGGTMRLGISSTGTAFYTLPAFAVGLVASQSIGDLIMASSGTALARLANGGANTVLTGTGTIPTYSGSPTVVNLTVNTLLTAAAATVTGIITGRDVTVVTNSETGALNNWAPTGLVTGTTQINFSGAAPAVTGIAGGSTGSVLILRNVGSGVMTLAHQSGSSSVGNKLLNAVTSAPTPVAAGGHATYVHNGTDWHLVEHEQGAAITIAHSDANFSGAGTDADWAVAVGDFAIQRYMLVGRQVTIAVYLATTTVANTPATLRVTGWPFTFSTVFQTVRAAYSLDNSVVVEAFASANGADTTINFTKTNGAAWANSTNATSIYFSGTFEVN